ncbi:hypothetical protein [Dyadobacter sediminis]|uniref:Uncharacterized protein n=1 Tax=Dyadobacter sediminis TaxID=1493691 RepID=A0A5R9KC87_9BACT|nr:hypothetical protein [Dyadobacter sediminis]TLU92394.1 hypothetical protein FEM55_16870 [Dyadobacter sediminis]GGB94801.1 hypothetical protein GCM10011325_22730 [Dyadobacter sediminis]
MQNERLFKKIKQTAERPSAAPEDWNAEKIWAKIEQRQQNNPFSRWMPYAAASAVFILGLAALIFIHLKEDSRANIHKNNIAATGHKAYPPQNQKLLKGNAADSADGKSFVAEHEERSRTIHKAIRQKRTGSAHKIVNKPEINVNPSGIDSVHVFADAGILEKEPALEAVVPPPHDTLAPLLQMFEHAKRVREERRMIVRLEEKNRSVDLLFFDHPAFIEHHPGREPRLFLQKR